MGKLYLFGIGGTGSRVIKSLTMLLASGVECGVDTIVPIIIDPDESGADITRTIDLLRKYSSIREKLDFDNATPNLFFRTDLFEQVQNYRLPLNKTKDVKFKEYMEVSSLSEPNKALINMLFSNKNLESDMKVGFKGNPNIGSVVLNQFEDSKAFEDFANGFQQDDKVFIISSIFGGTGASGFPLLLKTLRTAKSIPNFSLINQAEIGSISVLPYFGVKQDKTKSEIDSGTFISKTKSALSYYYDNISETNSINALYYLADDIRSQYDNNEGGSAQQNNAHFIELAAALAIIDFTKNELSKSKNTVHKEFGIENDSQQIIFNDLGQDTQDLIKKPLTQFILFSKFLEEDCDRSYSTAPWAIDRKIDKSYLGSQFIRDLKSLQAEYLGWLEEMDSNERSFSPFALGVKDFSFDFIKGVTPKKLPTLKSNYSLFNHRLSKQSVIKSSSKDHQFVELFFNATKQLTEEKYNF